MPLLPGDLPVGAMEILIDPLNGDLQMAANQSAIANYEIGARTGPGTGTWTGTDPGTPVNFFNVDNWRPITAPDVNGLTLWAAIGKSSLIGEGVQIGAAPYSMYVANGVYDLGQIVPAGLPADQYVSTLTNRWTTFERYVSNPGPEFRIPVYVIPGSHTATTPVPAGSNQVATLTGRLPYAGGVSVTFSTVTAGNFSSIDGTESLADLESRTTQIHFPVPGDKGEAQTWELSLDGQFGGLATVTFQYDPLLLPADFDPHNLRIEHFANGQWVTLDGTVDVANHTITVQTPSFSPFALGVATPEPATAGVMIGAAAVLVIRRRRTT